MDLAAAFAPARTEADHYRVRIAAENLLAPPEVAALAAAPDALPEPARAWIAQLHRMIRVARPRIQPFRRRALADFVQVYEGEGRPGARRDLVLGFTGVAQRMNLPAPVFVQALPAARCDVVILRDPAGTSFLRGVPGYAADPAALAARLAQDLPPGRYAALRCIGMSSGGMAALALGRALGAARAVSLGGVHPADLALRFAAPGVDRTAFDHLPPPPPGRITELVCAHAGDHARDADWARVLAAAMPGARVLAVSGIAAHGVVGALLQRRALARFLAEVLLGGLPAAALPDGWDPAPAGPGVSAPPPGSPG